VGGGEMVADETGVFWIEGYGKLKGDRKGRGVGTTKGQPRRREGGGGKQRRNLYSRKKNLTNWLGVTTVGACFL